jgi:hypothetical protein
MEAINLFHKPKWIEQVSPIMAVQSNTMSPGNMEASMSIYQKIGLFSRGPRQGFRPFMAWSALVVKFLEPFIRCNIHPNVLHGGACTESELGGSLLHEKVCSKMLSLNTAINIDGNQTFGRQFNTTQFIEASMENEDFGKELIVKVLFRGEQRWRGSCRATLCKSQSRTQHNTPEWWTLHPPGTGG